MGKTIEFDSGTLERIVNFDGSLEIKVLESEDVIAGATEGDDKVKAKKEQIKSLLKAAEIPGPSNTLRNYLGTLSSMVRNGGDIFVPTFGRARNNVDNPPINRGDHVVLFFHGYFQHAGAAKQFQRDAAERGYKVVALNYDYRVHPGDFACKVLFPEVKTILDQ